MKIVHITSAHPALDVRIFYKECLTLAEAGHEVHLVAPEASFKHHQGIIVHALNTSGLSRWQRLYKIYKLARKLPGDLYHFHDPEFIPFALLLKLKNKPIIYDVHEDTPRESFSFNKHRPTIAFFKLLRWYFLEAIGKIMFSGFVCATSHIAQNFPSRKTITVRNYVKIEEFPEPQELQFAKRPNTAIYVGNIMKIRGIKEMVTAINSVPTEYNSQLKLIGNFSPPRLKQEIINYRGFEKVSLVNWLARENLLPHFYQAKVGLVLLHPEKNFKEALPIKLFEYMAAGLPVIASDFPLWREIIVTSECGFVVNPFDVEKIREKIQFLFENPDYAEKLGKAGRIAVSRYYNWRAEGNTLTNFYRQFGSE